MSGPPLQKLTFGYGYCLLLIWKTPRVLKNFQRNKFYYWAGLVQSSTSGREGGDSDVSAIDILHSAIAKAAKSRCSNQVDDFMHKVLVIFLAEVWSRFKSFKTRSSSSDEIKISSLYCWIKLSKVRVSNFLYFRPRKVLGFHIHWQEKISRS